MTVVKRGDKLPVTLTVNHDLTGATTRLIVRHLAQNGDKEELAHQVTDPSTGEVTCALDGTWALGRHYLELEITQNGEIRTAPSSGYESIRIVPDLD